MKKQILWGMLLVFVGLNGVGCSIPIHDSEPEAIPTASEPPPAAEICDDGIDNDLDNAVDCQDTQCEGVAFCSDADGDNFTPEDGDCNDADETIHPDAIDPCNGELDRNCDGEVSPGPCKSCKEILESGASEGSGLYSIIAPLGNTFTVYCDMTTEGGGWSLILKAHQGDDSLKYHTTYWTQESLLNEKSNTPNTPSNYSNAKFPAYNQVPGDVLRLEYVTPVHNIHYNPGIKSTALELFQGGTKSVVRHESNSCPGKLLANLPDFDSSRMRLAKGHQFFGINGHDPTTCNGCTVNYLRFGFGANDESYANWAALIGIGTSYYSVNWIDMPDSDCDPYGCGCYGTKYIVNHAVANLWIR